MPEYVLSKVLGGAFFSDGGSIVLYCSTSQVCPRIVLLWSMYCTVQLLSPESRCDPNVRANCIQHPSRLLSRAIAMLNGAPNTSAINLLNILRFVFAHACFQYGQYSTRIRVLMAPIQYVVQVRSAQQFIIFVLFLPV